MSMTCSICKVTVPRSGCHQNRYGEYICRNCQAAGIRFSWPRRLRHQWGRAALSLWLMLGATAALLLLAWLLEFMRILGPAPLLGG
jgi:hypothetical protein